ncbi:MAG: threonine ammonia-lyase [Clostridia bacterium]
MASVTLDDVRAARQALRGITYVTPLQESSGLSDLLNTRLFLKLESLQRTGSFKLRGAYNRMRQMTAEEKSRGVVAASAGNHAQGVALAASLVGTSAVVVMPELASVAKVTATEAYGAQVELHGRAFDDAFQRALEIAAESGRMLIHAFEDPLIVAGQGTVGLEMLDAKPDLDIVVVPVGGGGLISGIALAAKGQNPRIKIIGVQAEGSDAMVRARRAGHVEPLAQASTIADGIAVKQPGDLTFSLIEEYVDDLVTVSDHDISRAILLFLERAKLVVEGAGAAPLAALLSGRIAVGAERVGVVVSGGNIDVGLLSRLLEKGLTEEGRQLHLKVVIGDSPGQLSRLLALIAERQVNVLTVEHERWHPGISPNQVEVRLILETRNAPHASELLAALKASYPDAEVLA